MHRIVRLIIVVRVVTLAGLEYPSGQLKLSRGEIFVANFIPLGMGQVGVIK